MPATADLRDRANALRSSFPQRRQQAQAPEDQGRRLATLARPRDDAEVRVSWAEYNGVPFLSVRQWNKSSDGQYWPDKSKGFSVRLRELPDFADAVAEALSLAEQHQGGRQYGGDRRSEGARADQDSNRILKHPAPRSTVPATPDFDEFG